MPDTVSCSKRGDRFWPGVHIRPGLTAACDSNMEDTSIEIQNMPSGSPRRPSASEGTREHGCSFGRALSSALVVTAAVYTIACLPLIAVGTVRSDAIYGETQYVAKQLPVLYDKMISIQRATDTINQQVAGLELADANAASMSPFLEIMEALWYQNNAVLDEVHVLRGNVTRLALGMEKLVSVLRGMNLR